MSRHRLLLDLSQEHTTNLGDFKRIEVSVAIVKVFAFRALEKADEAERDREHHELDEGFQAELAPHQDEDEFVGHEARVVEGQGVENGAVDGFGGEGGPDKPCAHVVAVRCDFHAGQHEGVDELSAEIGDHGGDRDPPQISERDLIGGLIGPGRGWWQRDDDARHHGCKNEGAKARPDDAARAGVAVNLGQDVAEHVGHGEEEHASAEREGTPAGDHDLAGLGWANHVGADKDCDEGCHHEIIVAIAAL